MKRQCFEIACHALVAHQVPLDHLKTGVGQQHFEIRVSHPIAVHESIAGVHVPLAL
jgi:hypothetical protein